MQANSFPASPSVAITSANSGLANDYLNIFNEVVMLIDVLPSMPEAMEDLIAWKASSYQDYFNNSKLEGHELAVQAYETMDPDLRKQFEDLVGQLDSSATAAVAALRIHNRRKGTSDPDADLTELARVRVEETEAASAKLGLAGHQSTGQGQE